MTSKHDHHAVIVKKIKKVNGGHHGGNWKVAYADFMTALMAFFLLLWILSGSDEEQLRGLAEYFSPDAVPLVDINGIGTEIDIDKSSDASTKDADAAPSGPSADGLEAANTDDQRSGAVNPWLELDQQSAREAGADGDGGTMAAELDRMAEELEALLENTPALDGLSENVIVTRDETGISLDIVDLGERPMFEIGSANVSEDLVTILTEVAPVFETDAGLAISITGHTDATPYRGGASYTNWELSADRANATRRSLLELSVDPAQIVSISGSAAVDLLLPDDPEHASNRRITIKLGPAQ